MQITILINRDIIFTVWGLPWKVDSCSAG